MRIPGFARRERRIEDAAPAGQAYVERLPGESPEVFETRLAAIARDRADGDREAEIAARGDRQAYDAGRRDQRRLDEASVRAARRRGGLGLVGVLVAVVAILGALWVFLAVREGSFAAGGAVVDEKIAEVAAPAKQAANEAVDRTGQAVQNAGQAIESKGERLRDRAVQ